MPSTADLPVVVVGAGPVGMTAALLLAGHGLRVVLLERHDQPYPLPRAVHVDDEVLRVLQAVGVAEDFDRVSRPGAGLRLLDAEHRVLATFTRAGSAGSNGYPQATMFDQPDLERLLRARLCTHPGIELRGGHTLVGLDDGRPGMPPAGDQPVRLELTDPSGATSRLWAGAVIGCDGANSTVRNLIGARLRNLGFTERWLVIDVRTAARLSTWDGVDQVCDPHRPATFMRVGPQRYRWEFGLRDGESEDDLTSAPALAALLAPWGAEPDELQILRKAGYTFKARSADRWRRGRVFLAGDAAHLTPPFTGQGLGAGLRDAHNLAWKVAEVLGGRADEALLETYRTERARHVRGQIRLAILLGRLMTRGGGPATKARGILLPLLWHVPGVRGAVVSSRTPRLRLTRAPQRRMVGELCPQPWVDDGGHRVRLDDVLGVGYSVIAAAPAGRDVTGYAERYGVPLVAVGDTAAHNTIVELDDPPILLPWLASKHAAAVLLRPDRVVAAVLRRPGASRLVPWPR